MQTTHFGPDKRIKLTEPLDTWLSAGLRDFAVPEALGSSARVFSLIFPEHAGDYANHPAIKVMRPDKLEYALPLFENEIQILDRMKDTPGVTSFLGLAFIKTESGKWPDEIAPLTKSLEAKSSAMNIAGIMDHFSPDETQAFLDELHARTTDGWLASIILPRRWEDNLYLRCDSGYTRGEFHRSFPILTALEAGHQISQILEAAHENNIVYLDHKVLHYYWNEPRHQVFALDWNIGRMITNGNTSEMFEFDVLQFGARALHHLLTGRQAPGSVKVGPNRPEDIQNAPHHYEPVWTYDDHKRLSDQELEVLGKAIKGEYKTAADLSKDLQHLVERRQSES